MRNDGRPLGAGLDGWASRRAPVFSPDAAEEALLRFVLADDANAIHHLHRWRELVELDDASSASHQLLPSAYLRMESCAPDDRDLGRLRGIYRQRWASGQQDLAAAEGAMRVLAQNGVRFLGPPDQLALDAVAEPLVLPIVTPRITVPESEVSAALRALRDAGWRLRDTETPASVRARLIQTEWELELDAQRGQRVLLGIAFNPAMHHPAHVRAVWARSTEGPDATSGERRPSSTDLFFALVSEAPRDASSMRWAIGSLAIARRERSFPAAESVFADPAAGYLLRCLESRLAFLVTVDPDCAALAGALEVARAAAERHDANSPQPRGSLARQATHRARQAWVLAASIRRHGGIRGTVSYLRRADR